MGDNFKDILCKSIHHILKTFIPPATAFDLAKLDTNVNDKEVAEMTKIVEQQAIELKPTNFKDTALIKVLVIGKKHRFPLLSYAMDAYNRWRLEQYVLFYQQLTKYTTMSQQSQVCAKIFRNIQVKDFFERLQKEKKFIQHAKGKKGMEILDWIQSSINVFCRRIVRPLKMHPTNIQYMINDSIICYAKYYIAILRTVDNLIKSPNIQLPLQIDFMIMPKAIRRSIRARIEAEIEGDAESSESDTDEEPNEEKEEMYTNNVGDLKKRLKTIKNVLTGRITDEEPMKVQRVLYKNINQLIAQQRSKRMVMLIDRRMNNANDQIEGDKNYSIDSKRKNESYDDLYAFLPTNSQNIPSGDYLHESMCNLSRTEVLPSINGKIGDKDVIHTGSNSMEMCLLSIHVHQADVVRAYWCRNGTVSRFFLNDMVRIWPYHFVEQPYDDNEDNGIEYQNTQKVQALIYEFGNGLLCDKNFENFRQENGFIEKEQKYSQKKPGSYSN